MLITKTKRLAAVVMALALMLALLPVITTPALAADYSVEIGVASTTDTVASIKSAIQDAINGAASGDKVTVTGAFSGADTTLTLDIKTGVTVIWQADYSGAVPGQFQGTGELLISLIGGGTFDIAAGSITNKQGYGVALEPSNRYTVLNGGAVINDADDGFAIRASGIGVSLVINDGEVYGNGNSTAVSSSFDLTINGGTIGTCSSLITGPAVNCSDGTATINGGDINGEIAVGECTFTIGPNADLILPDGVGLVMNTSGANFINNGKVSIDEGRIFAGTFINNGEFTNRSSLSNGGIVINYGRFINSGTITNDFIFCNAGVLNGTRPGGIPVVCGVNSGNGNLAAVLIELIYGTPVIATPIIASQLDFWLPTGFSVKLTATADDFFRIKGWADDSATVNGTNSTYTVSGITTTRTVMVELERIPLAGTVSVSGTEAVGQTLTADTRGITSATPGSLSYQWMRGTTPIGTDSGTYTLVGVDVGQTITVTVSAANYAGSLTSDPTDPVESTVGAAITTAAAESDKTFDSITVSAAVAASNPGSQDIEYLINTDGTDHTLGSPSAWQTGLTFSGLSASTTYYVWARTAVKTGYDAGAPVASAAITTSEAPGDGGSDGGGYIPPPATPPGPDPGDGNDGAVTDLGNGSTVSTPPGQDPVTGDDGSVTLPGGGTITTTGGDDGRGGVTIDVPPGTVIDNDGRISFPPGSGGGRITDSFGNTFIIPEDAVIILDMDMPLGFYISIDNPFADLSESDWYYDAVLFAYSHGLITGTSTEPIEFSPNMAVTRGMIVTLLYHLEGDPDVGDGASGIPFTDVLADTWYTDAVIWAYNNGIVSGYGNDLFGPEDNITREQMAVIIINYQQYSDKIPPDILMSSEFADRYDISDWAIEAVNMLTKQGIITGKPGNLFDPQGEATRAELAVMLRKFLESLEA